MFDKFTGEMVEQAGGKPRPGPVPDGYYLAVVAPDGTVLKTIDIAGTKLHTHVASAELGADLSEIIAEHEAQV